MILRDRRGKMSEHFSDRTRLMLGEVGYSNLAKARVAVFGVGGVGGYAVEALARAGVGSIDLIDSDKVTVSNINRQIIATVNTVGQYKTEAARDRILSINPDCRVTLYTVFYSAETADQIDLSVYDYIVDAIDSVCSKLTLISRAKALNVPIISSMGAGNKLDPTRFRVADISKTAVCPLAKAVRVGLRRLGINHLKVVYSEEPPATVNTATDSQNDVQKPKITDTDSQKSTGSAERAESQPAEKRTPPGSLSFVPSAVGLILAGEVILDLTVREKASYSTD